MRLVRESLIGVRLIPCLRYVRRNFRIFLGLLQRLELGLLLSGDLLR